MKPLKYFLAEREMERDAALKIMGLQPGYTLDQLKSRRKQLALQHHSDRGGDGNQMALINAAYDSLEKAIGGKAAASGGASRWDIRRPTEAEEDAALVRDKTFFNIAMEQFEDRMDSNAFTAHFEKAFNDKFTFTYTAPGYSRYGHYVSWNHATQTFTAKDTTVQAKLDWANRDRTTVIRMTVDLRYTDLADQKLFSSHNIDFKMYIAYEIMHAQRKVKLEQRSYSWKTDPAILTNPELLFPAAKIAQRKVKDKARAFAPRDYVATLEHQLQALISGSGKDRWVYIPIGKWAFSMYRVTLSGFGSWMSHSIVNPKGGSKDAYRLHSIGTFYETEKALKWFVDHIKPLQQKYQNSDASSEVIGKDVDKLIEDWKAVRGEMT